jgi:hypothetical protein
MRPTRSFRLLVGSILALSALPALSAGNVPDVIRSAVDDRTPIWASAEAATDPQTVLDWDLLGDMGPSLQDAVQRQSEKLAARGRHELAHQDLSVHSIPDAECELMLDLSDCEVGSSRTLKDLLQSSHFVFRGDVSAVDFGFAFGVPASLLTVEVTEVLKGSAEAVGSRVFVDHPVARFALGPYHFCNAERGFEPQAGDSILVFDSRGPKDRAGLFFAPGREQVFFESGAGGLFLPDQIKADPSLAGQDRLDQIVVRARERLQQRPRQ